MSPPPVGLLASSITVSLWIIAAVTTAGLLCVAYGVFVERRWYRTARYVLQVLPPASTPMSVLHLSDLHFLASDEGKVRFLSRVERPDVTVVTGDILGEPEAVETGVRGLGAVRGRRASFFVLGSNDYYAPRRLNYTNYFRKPRRGRTPVRSRTEDLVRQLEADGWIHLKNRRT